MAKKKHGVIYLDEVDLRKSSKPTRAVEITRTAAGIRNTAARYLAGCMARASWLDHMAHLWARAEDLGVAADVARLLKREGASSHVFNGSSHGE